jgi:hypothetical protein
MIAGLAGGQGGVVGRRQLRALGLGRAAVDHRVRAGRLHLVFRGVYAVGHRALRRDGMWWAAVLTCGDGAMLSYASVAAAWDLRPSAGRLVHVTVPDRRRIRQPGLVVHRPLVLPPEDVTTVGGIPATTAARTVFDLAADGLRGRALAAMLERGDRLGVVDFAELRRLVARHPRRAGSPAVAELLAGYAHHRSPTAFADDRERDVELVLAG